MFIKLDKRLLSCDAAFPLHKEPSLKLTCIVIHLTLEEFARTSLPSAGSSNYWAFM